MTVRLQAFQIVHGHLGGLLATGDVLVGDTTVCGLGLLRTSAGTVVVAAPRTTEDKIAYRLAPDAKDRALRLLVDAYSAATGTRILDAEINETLARAGI